MKKLLFVAAIAVLTLPICGTLNAQDESTDITNQLRDALGGGNNGNRGGNRGPQIPDSMQMLSDIKSVLSKGKTPLDKTQEKTVQSLLNKEVTDLYDRIQLLRNNNNNNNNNPQDQGRGGRGNQNNQGNNQTNNQQPNATEVKVETITNLKNDDFIDNKMSVFLTPEQVALVKKAKADDKTNSTCLGGLLDRYYNQMQNPNRGNNNNNYNNNNNNNNNNRNAKKPSGLAYCMTLEATPADRLEPIRKVLAKGNLPLAKDKDTIAELVMKAQLNDLETALRAGLTSNNNNNNRGNNNNNNNRNNNPQQIIQSTTDNIYKKVEAMLNPMQAEVLKKWHYEQMLGRGGIETLVAVEAMQDTPLTDEQYTKVTAAWPELRRQIQDLAKAAGKSITDKQRDSAAMEKILSMLEPSQEASYRLAVKYGPQAAAGK